jgi:pSer/pThr/pTyr-binding forkhead associated (FHA) protein
MKNIRIGRSEDNDYVLKEKTISSYHAEAQWDEKQLWLRDLNSTNGTFVNGHPIQERTLIHPNDTLSFGRNTVCKGSDIIQLCDHSHSTKKITIGRASDNDIIVSHGFISSHHAELLYTNNNWYIKDCNSTNGTYVNSQRIQNEIQLSNGDLVKFGGEGPVYIFPTTFNIELKEPENSDKSTAEEMLLYQKAVAAVHEKEKTIAKSEYIPFISQRYSLWTHPDVWIGLIVLVVMCLLFTFTGNPFAYNAYILFSASSLALPFSGLYTDYAAKNIPGGFLLHPQLLLP